MTTTDMPPIEQPPAPAARPRLLRRSRSDRFAAGVSGGLGEYFGVDPILFRVLFAVSALFGGSGILAYLIAWALIPDAGTEHAPVDGWVHKLRRHRVPVWAVAVGVGLVLWGAAFSWWAPGPFVPVVAVVVLVVVVSSRRDWQGHGPAATPTVDLRKTDTTDTTGTTDTTDTTGTAALGNHTGAAVRAWVQEAKRASRERRRRALPVKVPTLAGMAVVLIVLAAVDAVTGVPIVAYFWTVLGFVAAGLLIGVVLRRAPWSIVTLLPLSLIGVLAFAGSHASLHDGMGEKTWSPAQLAPHYRIGVGRLTLDLRHLSTEATGARTTRVTAGAGMVRVLVPRDANVEVQANVHIGEIAFTGTGDGLQRAQNTGVGARQDFVPPDGATGPRVVVDVHLADGQVLVERR